MTARNWCFTSYAENLNIDKDQVKYAVYQREKCPETAREHWQGFFVATAPIRFKKAKAIVGDETAHVEQCKGTADQNIAYCTKVESRKEGTDPIEIGDRKKIGQGKRSDLDAVVESIHAGASIETLAEEHGTSVIKYHRGIQFLIGLKDKHRDPNVSPEIFVYWGESGTGKTRTALEENPDAYILTKPNKDGNVWFDNYRGEKTIIVDEFYGWIPYDLLLRMCDRYPLQVPFKGGFVKFQATRMVFTSNKPWKEWYPNIEDTSAFERRIREFGKVVEFKKLAEHDVT